jgi:hypothetical protein
MGMEEFFDALGDLIVYAILFCLVVALPGGCATFAVWSTGG